MASEGWGLAGKAGEGNAAAAKAKGKGAPLPPAAMQAAHKGIVWLHGSAIAIWLIITVTLGALLLAGKHVPPIVVLIGAIAALGHALFLSTHVLLARQAHRKAVQAAAKARAA